MAQYTVGDYIRENRKKAGISQEELAYGVCEASTLSRIESGSQMPSRRTYEALMQKLGKECFTVFLLFKQEGNGDLPVGNVYW